MPQLSINQDYRFNYVLIGDRSQPVILLLHGFMGNCDDFSAVIDQLDGFCCLVIDLPGHGQTEVKHDANYLMPNVAQAIIELLKYLAIKQCWLWGYSMGGRIALYLTIYFPQYFWGAILESASPGLKTQAERDRRIERDLELAKRLESVKLSQFIHQWYHNPLFSSFVQHPDYQQAFIKRLNNSPFKLAKSLRMIGLGMQPSLWHCLSDIEISIMFMVGVLDPKFLTINRQMLDVCPQANLGIIPNTGHNIHFENPLAIVKMFKKLVQ